MGVEGVLRRTRVIALGDVVKLFLKALFNPSMKFRVSILLPSLYMKHRLQKTHILSSNHLLLTFCQLSFSLSPPLTSRPIPRSTHS